MHKFLLTLRELAALLPPKILVGRQAGLSTLCVDDPACLRTFYVCRLGLCLHTNIFEGISAASLRGVKLHIPSIIQIIYNSQ